MSLPTPVTRNEQYLDAIANGITSDLPTPVTREEQYLEAIAKGGGGGGTTDYTQLSNKPQINSVTLDGNNTGSDLGLQDELKGTQTATGNPITITDAQAMDAEEVKVTFDPVQDLHGYDKPWVGGAGKNKLPLVLSDIKSLNKSGTWSGNAYTLNGVTFTVNTNSSGSITDITVNGTETTSGGYLFLHDPLTLDNNNNYWMTGGTIEVELAARYIGGGVPVDWIADNGEGVAVPFEHQRLFLLDVKTVETMTNVKIYPMLRLATETDPTYEPYSNICPITGVDTIGIAVAGGENYTIDLDGTRYGGQLDVTTGELKVTDVNIASYAGESLPSTWISDRDEYTEGGTPTTGAQVVYKVVDPQTIQITPEQIALLDEENTISTDGTSLEVKYQPKNVIAECKLYTDKKCGEVLPPCPSEDGTYHLACTVDDGEAVISWEVDS